MKFASSICLVIGSIDYNRMGGQLAIIVDIVFIRLLVRHKQDKDTHSLVSAPVLTLADAPLRLRLLYATQSLPVTYNVAPQLAVVPSQRSLRFVFVASAEGAATQQPHPPLAHKRSCCRTESRRFICCS